MGKKKLTSKKESQTTSILPVSRTKEDARHLYDRISSFYDYFTASEKKYADKAITSLCIKKGETVLEIGFGTGKNLKSIAEQVGQKGKVYGIDISPAMLKVTKRKLEKTGLIARVKLFCGDAINLPYENNFFHAVFMSFTLELFDTPEIPKILCEIKRVLKPEGRLGVVSMSKENGNSKILRLYEWFHNKMPKYVDCRPIFLEKSIEGAGYKIIKKEKVKLFGLPLEIVVALNAVLAA
jgi:demethylmenaquinone methyltransferase/2-methoxy-6-polyprenyl-1,4-benzoquinol methylase